MRGAGPGKRSSHFYLAGGLARRFFRQFSRHDALRFARVTAVFCPATARERPPRRFALAQSRPLLLRELRCEKSRENFFARAKKHCNRWSRFAKPKSSADGVCVANPKHTIGGQVCKIHRATWRETRGISLSSLLTGLAYLFVLCLATLASDRRVLSLLLRSAQHSAGMHAFGRAELWGREDLNEPLVPFTAERIGQPAAPLTRRGGFIFAQAVTDRPLGAAAIEISRQKLDSIASLGSP
jgi:hypothetical protein